MANLNYYKRRIKQATLTEILIGINVIMFLLTQLVDVTLGNGLILLGAKVNILIGLGGYWRLLGAMFLHGGIMHLIFNMMALYILGRDIERFFGKKKFLMIYFCSGLAGSALSYLLVANTSVGASGAIFGLMGANLFLYKTNPIVYKKLYGSDLLILIGINVVIGFTQANIDMMGHLGGLICGFAVASAVGLKLEKIWTKKRAIFQLLVVLLILVPTFVGTIKHQSTSDFYIQGSYYYGVTKNQPGKGLRIANDGLKKFPTDANLIYLQEELKK